MSGDPDLAFALDPRIEADSLFVADFALCQVRLQNDARFAWLVLVPRLEGATEFTDLCATDRAALTEEIAVCAAALKACAPCDKINIGALGNIVPQLHIHVIARRRNDAAWPGPVWGAGAAEVYDAASRRDLIAHIRSTLQIEDAGNGVEGAFGTRFSGNLGSSER